MSPAVAIVGVVDLYNRFSNYIRCPLSTLILIEYDRIGFIVLLLCFYFYAGMEYYSSLI